MKRLTKLDKYGNPYTNEDINCRNLVSEDGINYQFVKLGNGVNAYDGKPIDKLYAIENIEEELGITLEVLFKALKNGIYYDYDGDIIDFSYATLFNDEDDCEWYLTTDSATFVNLKNYGKTWWLEKPKEEIKNEDEDI